MLVVENDGVLSAAVDCLPVVWKPIRRILEADENEKLKAKLLGLGHHEIGFAPVVDAGLFFHLVPDKLRADGIRVDFLELDHVKLELFERLVRSDRRVPRLVSNPPGNEVFSRIRIPEIAVAHLENPTFSVNQVRNAQIGQERGKEKQTRDEGTERVFHKPTSYT